MSDEPKNDNARPLVPPSDKLVREVGKMRARRAWLTRLKTKLKAGKITPEQFLAELDRVFGPARWE